ncbi:MULTISPECIES: restriction endonuclease [Streptomyces]|nr:MULTISPECIES: restriction endonuclease [Streptomyces]
MLAWRDPRLAPRDYEQIALQLTGHARAVAADSSTRPTDCRKTMAGGRLQVVLAEAEQLLSVPLEGTAACVQGLARMVRGLYERLDRLTEASPASA